MAAVLLAAACRSGGGSAEEAAGPGGTTTSGPPADFTIAATGDVLVHASVARAAAAPAGGHDFRPLLSAAAGHLRKADLAVCHLETPLSPPGATARYGPVFSVPGELAAGLADAGFDTCSTASNHALDAGEAGLGATLDLLDAAGLAHSGTARDRAEAARPALVRAGPATVGLLSYAFGLNDAGLNDAGLNDAGLNDAGQPRPPGAALFVNLIDEPRILAAARGARAAGADFVVVSLHWGTEYRTAPDEAQRSLARRLLASPAVDLILGHHSHVVGPVERHAGEVVAYSLGNFLSGQPAQCCPSPRDGMILEVGVGRVAGRGYRAVSVRVVPTRMTAGHRVEPAPEGSASWCATVAASGVGATCR